jgi:hypothetical protein
VIAPRLYHTYILPYAVSNNLTTLPSGLSSESGV